MNARLDDHEIFYRLAAVGPMKPLSFAKGTGDVDHRVAEIMLNVIPNDPSTSYASVVGANR